MASSLPEFMVKRNMKDVKKNSKLRIKIPQSFKQDYGSFLPDAALFIVKEVILKKDDDLYLTVNITHSLPFGKKDNPDYDVHITSQDEGWEIVSEEEESTPPNTLEGLSIPFRTTLVNLPNDVRTNIREKIGNLSNAVATQDEDPMAILSMIKSNSEHMISSGGAESEDIDGLITKEERVTSDLMTIIDSVLTKGGNPVNISTLRTSCKNLTEGLNQLEQFLEEYQNREEPQWAQALLPPQFVGDYIDRIFHHIFQATLNDPESAFFPFRGPEEETSVRSRTQLKYIQPTIETGIDNFGDEDDVETTRPGNVKKTPVKPTISTKCDFSYGNEEEDPKEDEINSILFQLKNLQEATQRENDANLKRIKYAFEKQLEKREEKEDEFRRKVAEDINGLKKVITAEQNRNQILEKKINRPPPLSRSEERERNNESSNGVERSDHEYRSTKTIIHVMYQKLIESQETVLQQVKDALQDARESGLLPSEQSNKRFEELNVSYTRVGREFMDLFKEHTKHQMKYDDREDALNQTRVNKMTTLDIDIGKLIKEVRVIIKPPTMARLADPRSLQFATLPKIHFSKYVPGQCFASWVLSLNELHKRNPTDFAYIRDRITKQIENDQVAHTINTKRPNSVPELARLLHKDHGTTTIHAGRLFTYKKNHLPKLKYPIPADQRQQAVQESEKIKLALESMQLSKRYHSEILMMSPDMVKKELENGFMSRQQLVHWLKYLPDITYRTRAEMEIEEINDNDMLYNQIYKEFEGYRKDAHRSLGLNLENTNDLEEPANDNDNERDSK